MDAARRQLKLLGAGLFGRPAAAARRRGNERVHGHRRRGLLRRDADDAPARRDRAGVLPEAAVINETLARRLWPNESAIGKRLLVGRTNPDPFEVVGVVKDSKIRTLGESRQLAFYVSVDQTYNNGMTLVVRSSGDQAATVAGVRQAVKELDARMPL